MFFNISEIFLFSLLYKYFKVFELSFNSEQLAEKIKKMDQNEAVEMLMTILSTSKNVESKIRAAELLIQFNDKEKTHFQDIKKTFLNDRHPQLRYHLINLLAMRYNKEGIDFLKEQYKNCKDGTVRKNLIEMVGQGNLNDSIPFFIEALSDANDEAKKEAITLLGKT